LTFDASKVHLNTACNLNCKIDGTKLIEYCSLGTTIPDRKGLLVDSTEQFILTRVSSERQSTVFDDAPFFWKICHYSTTKTVHIDRYGGGILGGN